MLDDLLHRLGALGRQGNGAGGSVIGVAAHLAFEPSAQFALLANAQLLKRFAKILLCPDGAQRQRFAVQPVGRPVGRQITAMAPDRTELLPASGKPRFLAALNLSF